MDFLDSLRDIFDEYPTEKDPEKVDALIWLGYEWIAGYKHPVPYTHINARMGTSWQRNTPLPIQVMDNEGDPYAPENQWPAKSANGDGHGHGHGDAHGSDGHGHGTAAQSKH